MVRTLRCGRSNPGSNPGHGMPEHFADNSSQGGQKVTASAGNRTRINCLEGSYADHYTTDAEIANIPLEPTQLKGYQATTTSVVHISTAKQ